MVAGTALLSGLTMLYDNPNADRLLLVLTLLLSIGLAAPSLGSLDVALDRTAAIAWFPRRVMHAALVVVIAGGTLLILGSADSPTTSTLMLIRDAVGLTGLAAAGVTLFGGALGWCLPMGAAVLAFAVPISADGLAAEMATWLVQPSTSTPALVTGLILGIIGSTGYALRGARH